MRHDGQRLCTGIESPHCDFMGFTEGFQQAVRFKQLHRSRKPRGRRRRIAIHSIGRHPFGQRHAGTGIDEHGHTRGKDQLVLRSSLKVEPGRQQAEHCGHTQQGEARRSPWRKLRSITPVEPDRNSPHPNDHEHRQRPLPPFCEAFQTAAREPLAGHVGCSEKQGCECHGQALSAAV
jgi:hypothetical protein